MVEISNWWESWVWQEHILPADYITVGSGKTAYKVAVAAKNLGWSHFHTTYPLWQYTEMLYVYEDVERLLDVLEHGDWLAMLKAIMAMEELNASHPRFLRLLDSISTGEYLYPDLATFTPDTKGVLVNYANAVLWRNNPAFTPEERAAEYARVMGRGSDEKPVFTTFTPDPDSTDAFDVWMRLPDVKTIKGKKTPAKKAAKDKPVEVNTAAIPAPLKPGPVPFPAIPRPPGPGPIPLPGGPRMPGMQRPVPMPTGNATVTPVAPTAPRKPPIPMPKR